MFAIAVLTCWQSEISWVECYDGKEIGENLANGR